jgi:hypothetical protein
MSSKEIPGSTYALKREQALDDALASVLLGAVVLVLLLLPTWSVRYVPLYDYQNHLLEAQVVADYANPIFGYAEHYWIEASWWARSNALSTLLVIGLGSLLPVEYAGKLVLSLYFLILVSGMTLLLRQQGKPLYLLAVLPLLAYNFTYTMGLLNWSFGFALLVWGVYLYMGTQQKEGWLPWLGLGIVSLLAYTAHILAWGLLLIAVFTLAAHARMSPRGWARLVIAVSTSAPLLLWTRPLLAAAPLVMAGGLWAAGGAVRRLRLKPWLLVGLGAAAVVLFFAGYILLREPIRARFPDIGYSPYAKLGAPLQLFTLPRYAGAELPGLELVNWLVFLLVLTAAALLAFSSLRPAGDAPSSAHRGWAAVLGVLLLGYFLIPTRTTDIITTEPRLLLVAAFAGMMAARPPRRDSAAQKALIGVLMVLGLVFSAAAFFHARSYDVGAQRWAGILNGLPAKQRVLVFSEPLPSPAPTFLPQLEQTFDQHQFSNTYALEQGGFVSTTFFNGPLRPYDARAIPPYWWDGFRIRPYMEQYCTRLAEYYDWVILWNPRSERLAGVLDGCYGAPARLDAEIGMWRVK